MKEKSSPAVTRSVVYVSEVVVSRTSGQIKQIKVLATNSVAIYLQL